MSSACIVLVVIARENNHKPELLYVDADVELTEPLLPDKLTRILKDSQLRVYQGRRSGGG